MLCIEQPGARAILPYAGCNHCIFTMVFGKCCRVQHIYRALEGAPLPKLILYNLNQGPLKDLRPSICETLCEKVDFPFAAHSQQYTIPAQLCIRHVRQT